MEPKQLPDTLSLGRYRVTFVAREPLDLPHYLGSTLRGAFGHAFRAIACPAPRGMDCPIPAQCPYHLIFETSPPPGAEALRTHEEIPRPFVISPIDSPIRTAGPAYRQQIQPGEEISFDLILIGRAQQYFPYFVVALREVNSIGRGRQAVEMQRIEASNGVESHVVYDAAQNVVHGTARSITLEECAPAAVPPGRVTIEFLTQTRLKHEGHFIRRPEFQILFRRLLGRLSSLARFHGGGPLELDFRGLIEQAASIRFVRDETNWTRWQRYSSRQDRRMEWEGIVGKVAYEGDFTSYARFLKIGELIHVGHGATFGLGKYIVRA